MVKVDSLITCRQHCFCIRFVIPSKQITRLRKELSSKDYKRAFRNDIKKTKVKVELNLIWGIPKKGKELISQKRLLGVELTPKNPLPYEKLYKVFPEIQERLEKLTQFGVKEFETTVCTTLGFSLKAFKPVGQLSLPADLTLAPELRKKLGEPSLTAFGIEFKNSPLGLEETLIGLDEEEKELVTMLRSGFKSKSLKGIAANVFEHIVQIAKLFVVKKE